MVQALKWTRWSVHKLTHIGDWTTRENQNFGESVMMKAVSHGDGKIRWVKEPYEIKSYML